MCFTATAINNYDIYGCLVHLYNPMYYDHLCEGIDGEQIRE